MNLSANPNYGIYASVSGGATNWAGYFVGNGYFSGNVGIGTTSPSTKLHVVGKTTLTRDNVTECCGNDATLALGENTQSTSRRASISFHNANEAEGQIRLIQNTINGVSSRRFQMFDNQSQGMGLELTGRLWYGNGGSRTETRDNAGLQGDVGAQSGFYETSNPVNFPSGASSWWHLIDCRHSNTANNYALQIAGSFFDQRLYFRKTNNNPSQPWTEILTGAYFQNNLFTVESTSQLAVTSTTFTLIPGMSVTVNNLQPGDRVLIWFEGNMYMDGEDWNDVDVALHINGTMAQVGGFVRVSLDNDYGMITWQNFSAIARYNVTTAGNYTFDVRARRIYSGNTIYVGGDSTQASECVLTVFVIKN